MSTTLKMLGLDPSMRNTGACLAEVDVITGRIKFLDIALLQTKAADKGKTQRQSSADLASCQELYRGLQKLAVQWKPDLFAGEVPTGAQSERGAMSNGMSTMLLATASVPVIDVSPKEVKLATVGKTTATKDEMIAWAMAQAPDLPWGRRKFKGKMELLASNEHMADACGVVAAAVETTQFIQLMAMYRSKAA